MLKLSFQVFLILAVTLYAAGIKISFNPFTVGLPNKMFAAGVFLFVLGFIIIITETYIRGAKEARQEDNEAVERILKTIEESDTTAIDLYPKS